MNKLLSVFLGTVAVAFVQPVQAEPVFIDFDYQYRYGYEYNYDYDDYSYYYYANIYTYNDHSVAFSEPVLISAVCQQPQVPAVIEPQTSAFNHGNVFIEESNIIIDNNFSVECSVLTEKNNPAWVEEAID
ncbi:hypothetical protein NIES970_16520 [[Synechococcus] sp. NIES-970]|uniref:hypothetical protein n=1 Tax=Picosynechococcus sp. NKBG15041c TaxID=1407650 RepID=UPI0003F88442|nr:hypothetical protein [Picosynechococcus sp. NKBG15041c]BAW96713.1 hypothetical protein NIES970_16520 [[Synechococcus] sp. NIES-970]